MNALWFFKVMSLHPLVLPQLWSHLFRKTGNSFFRSVVSSLPYFIELDLDRLDLKTMESGPLLKNLQITKNGLPLRRRPF